MFSHIKVHIIRFTNMVLQLKQNFNCEYKVLCYECSCTTPPQILVITARFMSGLGLMLISFVHPVSVKYGVQHVVPDVGLN